ncbi:MAG: hypothetical protein ACYDEF_01740 [Methanosarcina sp.]
MKFRRKPVISSVIDAEQYKPGMEDGFETRYQDVKNLTVPGKLSVHPKGFLSKSHI